MVQPGGTFYSALFLLTLKGAVGDTWGVAYSLPSLCVLRGSSAAMSCNYTYPSQHVVTRAFWCNYPMDTDLTQQPRYAGRARAACNTTEQRCSLIIDGPNAGDDDQYNCRILADQTLNKWTGRPGIMLSTTDLQVEIVGAATEGNNVTLACKTSCYLSSSPTYSWKKNGEPLEMEPTKNNELLLHPVSREDGGRYSCAVKGHEDLSSAEVDLNVTYSPKNTTALVSMPAEIPEGGSVTLSCSSDANPPVQNYTWFKENVTSPVAAGQNYTITNFTSAENGLYYCQAANPLGSQNSSAVPLRVSSPAAVTLISMYVGVAAAALVTLSALSWFFVWFCRRNREMKKDGSKDVLPNFAEKDASVDNVPQDDVQYSTISVQQPNGRLDAGPSTVDAVHYSTLKFGRAAPGDAAQYASVHFPQTGPGDGCGVVYSNVAHRK
ncbi:B-cell receptor CD22-like isoform X2 [Denticeps clupeoides]|uniref:B-cell receptor CD22-like isoform X2 n=1 Tax=Denticeps clupeoides TaxID=299321 RepID=UPI0010A47942|nr:B-cell receptor CD22-like isoform X2 [Denticeps clupeoides]